MCELRELSSPACCQSLHSYRPKTDTLLALNTVVETTAGAAGSGISRQALSPLRLQGFQQRDDWVQNSPELRARIANANQLPARPLDEAQIADMLAFLRSLTDPAARELHHLIPDAALSGLDVDD